ncbi:hypothetical protein ACLOJK_015349 [Asimina triloba]
MGCISSKIVRRSRSFREELISQSLKRRINGFPVLEDIIISNSKNNIARDDLLAHLVCPANTVAKKLQNGTSSSSSSSSSSVTDNIASCNSPQYSQQHDLEPMPIINAKQLMSDLEEERGWLKAHPQQHGECHCEGGEPSIGWRSSGDDGGGVVAFGGSSRSIRTVEEYDALLVEAATASNNRCCSQVEEEVAPQHRSTTTNIANELHQVVEILESVGSSNFTESLAAKQDDGIEEEEAKVVEASSSFIYIVDDQEKTNPAEAEGAAAVNNVEDGSKKSTSSDHHEKGSRRKVRARELSNLSIIPITIDFPKPPLASTSSGGDWTDRLPGHTCTFSSTAGDYVTPRFGSFTTTNCCGKEYCNVFDPELLASLEEAMKQMTQEEESILQQML